MLAKQWLRGCAVIAGSLLTHGLALAQTQSDADKMERLERQVELLQKQLKSVQDERSRRQERRPRRRKSKQRRP